MNALYPIEYTQGVVEIYIPVLIISSGKPVMHWTKCNPMISTVLEGNGPLPEPMLIHIYEAVCMANAIARWEATNISYKCWQIYDTIGLRTCRAVGQKAITLTNVDTYGAIWLGQSHANLRNNPLPEPVLAWIDNKTNSVALFSLFNTAWHYIFESRK